jgi:gamma-glutamyltranspeptidase / glutathione hydrolase
MKSTYLIKGILPLFILLLGSCKSTKTINTQALNTNELKINKSAYGSNGVVATAHPFATEVGLNVLKSGGNAADAAIAVQFALAVCYPVAGNIGGGGFMVYYGANKEISTLDFREKAPSEAHRDMYLDKSGNPITHLSLDGALAGGVPGTVDGMWQVFKKYSKLKDWKQLVKPAYLAAENGIRLTQREADGLNEIAATMDKINKGTTSFTTQKWKVGDLLIQKDLAFVLKTIMENGRDGFYTGKVADMISSSITADGGIISTKDLANYNSKWRNAITTNYRGHKVITMPPPSSGGIVLTQLLKAMEPFDLKSMGIHQAEKVHIMVEAERRAYADRASHMGDADFYQVPLKTLISDKYVQSRMQDIDPQRASLSSTISAGEIRESDQTTHYSIIDKEGNSVSITTTLNGGYGSKYVVKGCGFILNNEMDDFSVKPGSPNLYGLVGGEANKIEPNKRMLSSMTPTIVLDKEEKPYIIVGTPGGSTIITSVFQTIINVIDHRMSAPDAVAYPRFHHQWQPDVLFTEDNCLNEETRIKLTSMGHSIRSRGKIGRVELIVIKDGVYYGGADPRGDDDVKAY